MYVSVWAIVEPDPLLVPPTGPVIVATVHVNVVPAIVELNKIAVGDPLQTVSGRAEPTGSGLTVNVNVLMGPAHPFAVAVTFIVALIEVSPVFVAVYAGIFPVPLVPKPTLALLVQANVAPGVLLPKLIADAELL